MPLRYLRLPSATFVGRNDFLQTVGQKFGPFATHGIRSAAIWGLPGVGKSQAALQYALQNVQAGRYKHTAFIPAHDKNAIVLAVKAIVVELRLFDDARIPSLDDGMFLSRFKTWLAENSNWLLVFDNVTHVNDVPNFVPMAGTGHVLYTTKSRSTAELLTTDNALAMELLPLQPTQGIALVRALNAAVSTDIAASDQVAEQVASFAGGLPLAIEQLVQLAKFRSRSLQETLDSAKDKHDFLKREHPSSFHENDFSTGAILIASLEALKKDFPPAAALFTLMSYMQPSSIPRSMLTSGALQMGAFLDRISTYDRGAIRTAEGHAAHARSTRQQQFNLYDYDPWDPALYRRLFRLRGGGSSSSTGSSTRPATLPRGDSQYDTLLRNAWHEPTTLLRTVFSDPNQTEAALTNILASGLVRKLDASTFWIHDLFASLTTAYVAAVETPEASATTAAHLAATTVYLAFPPAPARFARSADECLALLPHARATLAHLRDAGIVADVAVGPELSALAASTIWLRTPGYFAAIAAAGGSISARDQREVNEVLPAAIELYVEAYRGYAAAENRVVAALEEKHGRRRARKRILRALWSDWELEDDVQKLGRAGKYYSPARHAWRFERFGHTPTRRKIDVALKIGLLYIDAGQVDEARRWLELAKTGYEMWFGLRHDETIMAMNALANLCEHTGDWDGALRWHERLFETMAEDSWQQTGVLLRIGRCFGELGRWREAVIALEMVYDFNEQVEGRRWSDRNISLAKELAGVSARAELSAAAVGWWGVYWTLLLCEGQAEAAENVDADPDLSRPGWWLAGSDKWRVWAICDLEEAMAEWKVCKARWRFELDSGAPQGVPATIDHMASKVGRDAEAWIERLKALRDETATRERRTYASEEAIAREQQFTADILRRGNEKGLVGLWC